MRARDLAAEAVDQRWVVKRGQDLTAQVQDLTAQVIKLTGEKEELQAHIDLDNEEAERDATTISKQSIMIAALRVEVADGLATLKGGDKVVKVV
eukprot:gene10683-12373_t